MIRALYNFVNRNWWQVVSFLLLTSIGLLVVVMLGGCFTEARSPDPAPSPSPFPALSDLGVTLTWAGGICAAAGIVGRILSFVYPPLSFLGGFAGFAFLGGAAVTVTGAACQYLADRPLLVLGSALLCAAGMGWWYWPRIRRALDRRLDGKA